MARIPEEELARLKREVSIERLVAGHGVELRRRGEDLVGLCPFHDDREPSLIVSPSKNLWHCLGACGEGGSVIDWVMRAQGVGFREAVARLQAIAGRRGKRASAPPSEEPPLDGAASDAELLAQYAEHCQGIFRESRKAQEYLERRGLGSAEAAERFRIGFSNRTLGLALPPGQVKAGREIRERLARVGVLRKSGHEHFVGAVTFPVWDEAGRVVEIYGRKIRNDLRRGTAYHLYLPGRLRGVWNVEALQESREVILCEAILDALTFWVNGFPNVTAAYGVNGFTEDHREAFRRHGVRRVLLAYDRDEAGETAAAKLAEELLAEGIDCYRVEFPRGLDANSYALSVKPPAKSLELAVRSARWMGTGTPPARRTVDLGAAAPKAAKEEHAAPEPSSLAAGRGEPAQPSDRPAAAASPEPSPEPAEPPPSARPAAPAPTADVPAQVHDEEVVIVQGDRRYRVRGLGKNLAYEVLKVNVLTSRPGRGGDAFHVDTLDLYQARQRTAFVKQAAEELGVKAEVVKKDLGRVLLKLEELQDEQIRRALTPETPGPVVLTPEEREDALALLRDPELLERIVSDLGRIGLVGEAVNKTTAYLAAVSRKLPRPLAVVVQSSSAAGKSALLEAVLSLVPLEERVSYSAMTGQSLFYMGETDLRHKVLAVAEEEGAERASYALKLLQSEGELTIASTGKDPQTGRLVTHEYRVEGPVAILLTTTAIDVDEELLNRCLVLSVSEAREQTRAIHRLQRERRTLEGLLAGEERAAVLRRHRNAQRLLRPLPVVNPYAPELTFLDGRTRTRRDHEKYLTLIDATALLHQHQREVKRVRHGEREIEYVEVELSDVEAANRLAGEVLGRSLDELPPQTRRLLALLDELVTEACERLTMERSDYRFTRREARAATGWADTQLRVHLGRLVEMEYVLVHQGARGRSYVYELVYEAREEAPERFLPGLIDVERLRERGAAPGYDGKNAGSGTHPAGSAPENAPPSRPHRGGVAGGPRGDSKARGTGVSDDSGREAPERTSTGHIKTRGSYRSEEVRPRAARSPGGSS